jgi:hypothetical protein
MLMRAPAVETSRIEQSQEYIPSLETTLAPNNARLRRATRASGAVGALSCGCRRIAAFVIGTMGSALIGNYISQTGSGEAGPVTYGGRRVSSCPWAWQSAERAILGNSCTESPGALFRKPCFRSQSKLLTIAPGPLNVRMAAGGVRRLPKGGFGVLCRECLGLMAKGVLARGAKARRVLLLLNWAMSDIAKVRCFIIALLRLAQLVRSNRRATQTTLAPPLERHRLGLRCLHFTGPVRAR